jgi:hypothetical protein
MNAIVKILLKYLVFVTINDIEWYSFFTINGIEKNLVKM